jgi:hypothetical protein
VNGERRAEPKKRERGPETRRQSAPAVKSAAVDTQRRRPGRPGPPGVIVKRFKRVGQLQLHRLGERATFDCVDCRRRKTSDLIAIRMGSWKRMV